MNELQMQNIGGIDYHLKDQYARDIIATSENGLDSQSDLPISSRPYAIGEYLIDQNRLYYEVIDTISTGDVLVVGSNIKRTTVSAEINKLKGNSAIMAIEIVAPIEDALLSTREYQEGDSLYWLNEHLSGLYDATMHIVIGDALAIGTNIKPAKKVAKSVKDINDEISDMTGILGAKNLCPNNASTVTQSGVTYTVNADGSVKITGTATANSSLVLGYTTLPKGKYKLTTGQANESVASQYLYIQEWNNDTWGNVIGSSKDNSGEFTLDADTRVGCLIGCDNGRTGVTTVYPMCRPVTIIDESYVPHVPTNRELDLRNKELNSQIDDIANLVPKNYGVEDIPLQRGGAMDANLAFKRIRIFNANSGSLPSFAPSGNNDMMVINHWYADSSDSEAIQVAYNLRADNVAFRRFIGGWQPWRTIV